jgi:hypothetical protein
VRLTDDIRLGRFPLSVLYEQIEFLTGKLDQTRSGLCYP